MEVITASPAALIRVTSNNFERCYSSVATVLGGCCCLLLSFQPSQNVYSHSRFLLFVSDCTRRRLSRPTAGWLFTSSAGISCTLSIAPSPFSPKRLLASDVTLGDRQQQRCLYETKTTCEKIQPPSFDVAFTADPLYMCSGVKEIFVCAFNHLNLSREMILRANVC